MIVDSLERSEDWFWLFASTFLVSWVLYRASADWFWPIWLFMLYAWNLRIWGIEIIDGFISITSEDSRRRYLFSCLYRILWVDTAVETKNFGYKHCGWKPLKEKWRLRQIWLRPSDYRFMRRDSSVDSTQKMKSISPMGCFWMNNNSI